MGCGAGTQMPEPAARPIVQGVPVHVAPGHAQAPVREALAVGFLEALEAEYVRRVDQGVGQFLDSQMVSAPESQILDDAEKRVETAQDAARAIAALRAEWGLAAVARPLPASALRDVNSEVSSLQHALALPSSTAPREVVLQGLVSDDSELLRRSLALAPTMGLAGSAQFNGGEAKLRAALQLPPDWEMSCFAQGKYLEGGCGGRQESAVVAYQLQHPGVVRDIQGLFDATYRKVYTRDRRGVPIPDRFVVREVHRVMNDQVWREYTRKREEIRQELGGVRANAADGVHTMNFLASLHSSSLPPLDGQVNESWLFHGTTGQAAQGIAENDFRLDLSGSNAGTLYGRGIYLAENATKSDEYGEGPKGPAGEQMEMGFEGPRPPPGPPPPLVRESYILLCRSLLGRINYNDERIPDPDKLQQSCVSGEYHSVLGDRLKLNGTFREIIVYHDDYAYPEYIIKYERIFFHERFAEIYQTMSQRKEQEIYKGPTAEEREVLTSMWAVFGMPNKGKINKWQLLDLLNSINQPPENENEDLDLTFEEWDTKKDGWIDCDEFLGEMHRRISDGMVYY